jgi:hypothetical protein
MDKDELYNFVFHFFETIYFLNESRYDKLGIILGQMSTETFGGGDSADPAMKDEFSQSVDLYTKSKGITDLTYSIRNALEISKYFLIRFNNEWGYELSFLLEDLSNIDEFIKKNKIDLNEL